jgi:hypothetical protein
MNMREITALVAEQLGMALADVEAMSMENVLASLRALRD